MQLNSAAMISAIKAQSVDKPTCVLTIYRWFFDTQDRNLVKVPLVEKIRLLEKEGFKFSLKQVFSTGKRSRYLHTDLMVTFPDELGSPYTLGARVPEGMIIHLDQHAGLRVYKADSKLEDEDEAA